MMAIAKTMTTYKGDLIGQENLLTLILRCKDWADNVEFFRPTLLQTTDRAKSSDRMRDPWIASVLYALAGCVDVRYNLARVSGTWTKIFWTRQELSDWWACNIVGQITKKKELRRRSESTLTNESSTTTSTELSKTTKTMSTDSSLSVRPIRIYPTQRIYRTHRIKRRPKRAAM